MNAAADQNRDDLVSRLKKELEEKTTQLGNANARVADTDSRMKGYEAKELARITSWQEDAKDFMCGFVNEEVEAHHPQLKDDVAVFTGTSGWAHTYHEKPDIQAQGALAAVSYVASKGIKRLREQASQGAAAANTLAETMKANEELTAQNSKLQKDYQDAMTLCDERQKGLETLQAELIKGGLMNEKFNFSKLTSREQDAGGAALGGGCGGGGALARGRQGGGLQGCGQLDGQPGAPAGPSPVAPRPQQRWPAHGPVVDAARPPRREQRRGRHRLAPPRRHVNGQPPPPPPSPSFWSSRPPAAAPPPKASFSPHSPFIILVASKSKCVCVCVRVRVYC